MKYESLNFDNKFSKFSEQWSPKVIAEMNDYQFKLVKIKGDFVWHDHKDTDEVFMVISGEMEIEFRDGKVKISEGEMFVIEPRGVVNTGETGGNLKAGNDVWI